MAAPAGGGIGTTGSTGGGEKPLKTRMNVCLEILRCLYHQSLRFSAARSIHSPQLTDSDFESNYLTELLAERQDLGPFMQIFPNCSRLLDQEILQVSGRISSYGLGEYGMLPFHGPSLAVFADAMLDMARSSNWNGNGWNNNIQPEGFDTLQAMFMDWQSGGSFSLSPVRKILRIDVPVDRYPNFNFMGRLLGPRGNSLKRIEAATHCHIYIKGRGSIKDHAVESLRGTPGYEHLNEPMHIIIEAHLPINAVDRQLKQAKEIIEEILKPVDASRDFYKKQQLRELAILNRVGA